MMMKMLNQTESSPPSVMIRRAREAAGLTRHEAALVTGISERVFEGWEQGRYVPRPDRCTHAVERLGAVSAEDVRREVRLRLGEAIASRARLTLRAEPRGPERSVRYAQLVKVALACTEPRPSIAQVAAWAGFR